MAEIRNLELALELLTSVSEEFTPQSALATCSKSCVSKAIRTSRGWNGPGNIVGMGIGLKRKENEETDELCLKVYVREKYHRSALASEEVIDSIIDIDGIDEPIPTDVEAVGEMHLEGYTARRRPACPGYSIGHYRCESGTFGCLVHEKGDPNEVFILSASHVLANSGLGRVGDAILQCGRTDGGRQSTETIAELYRWIPFDFTGQYVNIADAAIAKPVNRSDVDPCIVDSSLGFSDARLPRGAKDPVRGMIVQKTGRTTMYTIGIVKDVHFRTSIVYPMPQGGRAQAYFRDQVLCTRCTNGGDSGSLFLDGEGYAVGLHYAGSSAVSIFSPIKPILKILGVKIVTQPA